MIHLIKSSVKQDNLLSLALYDQGEGAFNAHRPEILASRI